MKEEQKALADIRENVQTDENLFRGWVFDTLIIIEEKTNKIEEKITAIEVELKKLNK